MEQKKVTNSSSHERREVFYATPRNEVFVKKYSELKDTSISKVVNEALTKFYDQLPPTEKTLLLRQINNK